MSSTLRKRAKSASFPFSTYSCLFSPLPPPVLKGPADVRKTDVPAEGRRKRRSRKEEVPWEITMIVFSGVG